MKTRRPSRRMLGRALSSSLGLSLRNAALIALPLGTLATLAAGCNAGPDGSLAQNPLADGQPFVAISRTSGAGSTTGIRQQALSADTAMIGGDGDFFLAVNKKELGQRWFLSAYMKQAFPGAVSYGAARQLGTKVVTFKVQNGKLHVFLADDLSHDSDTFDPTILIEAYPLVTGSSAFNALPGAEGYVLFDPAAGLNHFNAVSDDFFQTDGKPDVFTVELSFLQRFRPIADGVTYEQVLTGFSDRPDPNAGGGGEVNPYRTTATLGIGLRRYGEGAGYQPFKLPTPADSLKMPEYFFRSEPKRVIDTGKTAQTATKWNIYQGMPQRTITWVISDKVDAVQADPRWKDIDIYGALKKGVENWNAVFNFGYNVLQARKGTVNDSFADDDTNYLIFDQDPSYGAAFADWRQNPNTGEIRGASVYYNALWLDVADQIFTDDPPKVKAGKTVPQPRPQIRRIVWEPLQQDPLCMMWAPTFRPGDKRPAPGPGVSMTKKEKVEEYLTHVALHEVGHTLGLRHNFKGSLVPPSSSVMEYVYDPDAIQRSMPGSYDFAAIKLLYGLSTDRPKDPFCTDDGVASDPDCTPYDATATPLTSFAGPRYKKLIEDVLKGTYDFTDDYASYTAYYDDRINALLKYVRATGVPFDVHLTAWNLAFVEIATPLDAGKVAMYPTWAPTADLLTRFLLTRLFLDPASSRGDITNDPPLGDTTLEQLVLTETVVDLVNQYKVRSYATRRVCVDVLKKLQSSAAYDALKQARARISAGAAGLTGAELAQTNDLLARIDKATAPYFNN